MPRRRGVRAGPRVQGGNLARENAVRLGAATRDARGRRGWSRQALGEKVGLGATRVGQIERGAGAGVSLEVWFALGQALDMPFRAKFARDRIEEPLDAGHLAMQELMLRLGRETGRARTFELATRPGNPALSIDVCTRDDAPRVLTIEECWNSFGNINESVRSTRRKVAEAQQLAVAAGGNAGPYRVAAVWVVRDTRRNREILARYPEVFTAAFTGLSRQWVAALTTRTSPPPPEMGLVWSDLRATRLFAWRR